MKAPIFALLALSSVLGVAAVTPAQNVQTSSGLIVGHTAVNQTSTWEYLGIRYAKPPLGPLRFMPPAPYKAKSGKRYVASQFSGACPENGLFGDGVQTLPFANTVQWAPEGINILNIIGETNVTLSEDCLTLNVWVPKGASSEPRAVMLWIHGGGFGFGSSRNVGYRGEYLSNQQDVVVVSINYRTNIFGFPAAPNQRDNLGLLDMRAAVQWVHQNIAAFGGNPNLITMFGQSAGGAALDYYSFAYYDDPLGVAGQIQQSGTVFGISPASSLTSGINWNNAALKAGCGIAPFQSDAQIFQCMQGLDYRKILAATSGQSVAFQPTIDEVTVFSNYSDRAKAKQFLQIPMLIGNTNYELGVASPVSQASVGVTLPQASWQALTEQTFGCPAAQRVVYNLAAQLPTWRYRWFGDFSNLQLSYSPYSASYHASELGIIFNTSGLGFPDSPNEIQIGNFVRGGWGSFAKDPQNGLTNYGWPRFDSTTATLLRLSFNNQTGTNLGYSSNYDSSCTLDS